MNLIPIPRSSSELQHLDKRGLGFGRSALAQCIARRKGNQPLSVDFTCGNPVHSGTGFADTEGPPFRAYYCHACGLRLGGRAAS
ncbi:MAG TPA: hypothetical protein P5305_03965 [Rubrivivax sp.]|nr:hypothetical protein [Rubrivivax sp.]HRY87018.1 hypothetical protein [Rubrivivax sp.]